VNIGEKIRNAREDLDLTQDEVSAAIPMNQSSYSKIERDLQEPSIEQLRRICQILNLDSNYLLSLGKYENDLTADLKFANEVKKLYEKYF